MIFSTDVTLHSYTSRANMSQCNHSTKKGAQCKRNAVYYGFCDQHARKIPGYVTPIVSIPMIPYHNLLPVHIFTVIPQVQRKVTTKTTKVTTTTRTTKVTTEK